LWQLGLSLLIDAMPHMLALLPDGFEFKRQALALTSKAVAEGAAHSAHARFDLLKEAWLLIQANPWFGVGWRRYQLAGVMSPAIEDRPTTATTCLCKFKPSWACWAAWSCCCSWFIGC
jgi:O-antigen ligase